MNRKGFTHFGPSHVVDVVYVASGDPDFHVDYVMSFKMAQTRGF